MWILYRQGTDRSCQPCVTNRSAGPKCRTVEAGIAPSGFPWPAYRELSCLPAAWTDAAQADAFAMSAACRCLVWSATSGLEQTGYTIQPGPHQLASLDDLATLPAAQGITYLFRERDSALIICEFFNYPGLGRRERPRLAAEAAPARCGEHRRSPLPPDASRGLIVGYL